MNSLQPRNEMLAQLVAHVNYQKLEVPIFLHLETFSVRGQLVANSVFAEAQREHLALHAPSLDEKTRALIAQWSASENEARAVMWLHVREATIRGHGEPMRAAWWRGRLEDVSSFSLPHPPQETQIPASYSGFG